MKQIDWEFIKHCLMVRREAKKLKKLGYRKHETDWEIHRGERMKERIIDVKISADGLYVWTKIGPIVDQKESHFTPKSTEDGGWE